MNLLGGTTSICWGCHDKVPQGGWLKTTDIIVCQFRSLEVPNEEYGRIPPRSVEENPSLPPTASGICQQSLLFLAYRLIAPFSAFAITWHSPSVSLQSLLCVFCNSSPFFKNNKDQGTP